MMTKMFSDLKYFIFQQPIKCHQTTAFNVKTENNTLSITLYNECVIIVLFPSLMSPATVLLRNTLTLMTKTRQKN